MGLGDRDYYKPSGFGGFSFFPPIIKNLLIINGIVFFIQVIFDNLMFGQYPGFYIISRYFALNPIGGVNQIGIENNFQIWQLITYQFLHGNFSHILFNMFALWMFGMEVENQMGSKKFLIFYLSAGVVGGLLQVFLAPLIGGGAPTIGASGSVYGVLIAFALFYPDRYIFLLFPPIPIKAKYLIAVYMIMEFMSVGDGSVVAHLVHIGGAVGAAIFVLWDRKKNFNFEGIFRDIKQKVHEQRTNEDSQFRRSAQRFRGDSVKEAEFYDINGQPKEPEVSQEEIDRILDKISKSGYQNLTDGEKRILFEASKKK
ncbi:MAG: rhomboid family intramembrane serine protease [Bacteroidetes bacterium]|nr:rhomboid family intramembrane serine protease [Bacteroidota bacterium]